MELRLPKRMTALPSVARFRYAGWIARRHASKALWAIAETALTWVISLQDFDLSKGESPDSTTAYGLSFLEQIRRTADKK
jgi:hypothetical protein